MYDMTWEEYSNRSMAYTKSINSVDYTLLIGYLEYCLDKDYNAVDKYEVTQRLAFIKMEIDAVFIKIRERTI